MENMMRKSRPAKAAVALVGGIALALIVPAPANAASYSCGGNRTVGISAVYSTSSDGDGGILHGYESTNGRTYGKDFSSPAKSPGSHRTFSQSAFRGVSSWSVGTNGTASLNSSGASCYQ
jgi:streptogramin lyase